MSTRMKVINNFLVIQQSGNYSHKQSKVPVSLLRGGVKFQTVVADPQ